MADFEYKNPWGDSEALGQIVDRALSNIPDKQADGSVPAAAPQEATQDTVRCDAAEFFSHICDCPIGCILW